MWMLCGQGSSSRAVPLHDLVDVLDAITVDVLPAAHALMGCGTKSKTSTKQVVLKVVVVYSNLLKNFAKQPLSEETFLVHCYQP